MQPWEGQVPYGAAPPYGQPPGGYGYVAPLQFGQYHPPPQGKTSWHPSLHLSIPPSRRNAIVLGQNVMLKPLMPCSVPRQVITSAHVPSNCFSCQYMRHQQCHLWLLLVLPSMDGLPIAGEINIQYLCHPAGYMPPGVYWGQPPPHPPPNSFHPSMPGVMFPVWMHGAQPHSTAPPPYHSPPPPASPACPPPQVCCPHPAFPVSAQRVEESG